MIIKGPKEAVTFGDFAVAPDKFRPRRDVTMAELRSIPFVPYSAVGYGSDAVAAGHYWHWQKTGGPIFFAEMITFVGGPVQKEWSSQPGTYEHRDTNQHVIYIDGKPLLGWGTPDWYREEPKP